MDPRIDALRSELEAMRSELVELEAITEPTDDQVTRSNELLADWDAKKADLDARVARAEKVALVRTAALDANNVEPAFHAPHVSVKRSAFENLEGIRSGMVGAADLRARALNAIEESRDEMPDAHREQATALAQRSAGIAKQMLLTGSPAYRSAFEKALANPDSFASMFSAEEAEAFRTALSTTSANGGYAIPFLLDPTIVLTNDGSANPFRQISRVESGMSNKWNGLSSAGVTAEWKTEGSPAADASPTFIQPVVTAYLADAYVLGSYEVLEDTNLAVQLPALLQDAKDNLEATAFATGSGSQPQGIVTAVTAVTASRVSPTTGGTFTVASRADVDKVIEAVPPRNRSNASWVANYATYGIIRRMDTYGGSAFWANLGASQPSELLGRPQYESSAMASTVTTGSNILIAGDFSQYLIYDRVGMTVEYIPNVFDTSTGRPTGQRGWIAHWRTGANVLNANAFRVLKL